MEFEAAARKRSVLPTIHAVADQLKQVLLNLVLNAAEAMADGGLLQKRGW